MIFNTALKNAMPKHLTRKELYQVLDDYLEALQKGDPNKVQWAPRVRYTENNVALLVGDGMWNTTTGYGDYDLRFADPQTGGVAFFGLITETDATSPFSIRIKVEEEGVAEIETVVVRDADEAMKFPNQKFEYKPVMNEILDESSRVPREKMIALADGYFDTLQLNDGTIMTKIHPDCNRMENGHQATNNPDSPLPYSELRCEDQFKLGKYRYDDRLRARRYPLVDEERGLVLSGTFIDHVGKLGEYELTDGTKATTRYRRPHSFYLLELFKIKDGALEQVEANFITVPYHMPSPWDTWRE